MNGTAAGPTTAVATLAPNISDRALTGPALTRPGPPLALPRTSAAPALARVLRLCLVEARPSVLVIFMLRFLAGVTIGAATVHQAPPPRVAGAAFAWGCAVLFVYLYNGAADLVEDRAGGKGRPIARGALPAPTALRVCLGLFVAAELLAWPAGGQFATQLTALLLLGFAYSCPQLALKRHCVSAALVAAAGGLLTFLAGATAVRPGALGPAVWVLAGALSAWMGLVGSVAKDFSDVRGDRAAGRRTLVLLIGRPAAGAVVALTAVAVGTGFVAAGRAWAPQLLGPALMLLCGALVVAALAVFGSPQRHARAPYRAFMVTQYLVTLATLGIIVLR